MTTHSQFSDEQLAQSIKQAESSSREKMYGPLLPPPASGGLPPITLVDPSVKLTPVPELIVWYLFEQRAIPLGARWHPNFTDAPAEVPSFDHQLCPDAAGAEKELFARASALKQAHQKNERELFVSQWTSYIPTTYQTCDFDKYAPQTQSQGKALLMAKNLTCQPANCLLGGPAGVGKTHLLVSAAKMLIQNGTAVLFEDESALLARWRRSNGNYGLADRSDEPLPDDIVDEIVGFNGIYFLDDFGSLNPSEKAWGAIWSIINGRYSAGRLTWISTNKTNAELASQYGGKLVSRLMAGQWLWIDGPDWRVQGGGV